MDSYCRLCLSMTTEHFYEINNSKYQKQIETVMPELNINNIQAPLLCQKCSIVLEGAYELKTRSLRIDKYLSVFVDIMQTDVVPVSEIFNIKKELDGDLKLDTKDNISFEPVAKIEENTALCDDASVGLTPAIQSSVKDEPQDDSTTTLDEENHSVDLNHQSPLEYLVSEQDLITAINSNEGPESHQNATQSTNLDVDYSHNANFVAIEDVPFGIPKPAVCKICRKRFIGERSLKDHMTTKHKSLCKEVPCKICGEKIENKRALLRHYKTKHKGENKFRCKLCNAGCYSASDLRKHVRQHGFGMQLV